MASAVYADTKTNLGVAVIEIEGFKIEGHDGHNVAVVDSKTTGIPHVVCHDCRLSLKKIVKCEVYSRPCGYLAPTNRWNNGKSQEFTERKTYRLKELVNNETAG